jgi:hypothetical protein
MPMSGNKIAKSKSGRALADLIDDLRACCSQLERFRAKEIPAAWAIETFRSLIRAYDPARRTPVKAKRGPKTHRVIDLADAWITAKTKAAGLSSADKKAKGLTLEQVAAKYQVSTRRVLDAAKTHGRTVKSIARSAEENRRRNRNEQLLKLKESMLANR